VLPHTRLEVADVGAKQACTRIGDGPYRPFNGAGRRRNAWQERHHQHARIDARARERGNGLEPLRRRGGARLEFVPDLLVHGSHAHDHLAAGTPCRFEKNIHVPHDERALGDQRERRVVHDECFETAAGEPISPFRRLVGVGCRAYRDALGIPARASNLTTKQIGDVALDEDQLREIVPPSEIEVPLVLPRIAVLAGMGAAPIGIERPPKRHASGTCEGRTHGDLLVAGLVGEEHGAGQAFNATEAHGIGHCSEGRRGGVWKQQSLLGLSHVSL